MAKFEKVLYGEFDTILGKIENGVLNGSISASLEESSDFGNGDARCSVRVFERYSYAGGNRVSLSVTLFKRFRHNIGGQPSVVFQNEYVGRGNIPRKVQRNTVSF